MELVKIVCFEAMLSKERKGIEKENNVEVYSLNQSFQDDDILWRFSLVSIGLSDIVHGFVEKMQKRERLQFTWEEAEAAIKGNFLAERNVSIYENSWKIEEHDFIKHQQIAFTLRTRIYDRKELEHLELWDKRKIEDERAGHFWVETGPIHDERVVSNVHGLLTLEWGGKWLHLEDYAQKLKKVFPKKFSKKCVEKTLRYVINNQQVNLLLF